MEKFLVENGLLDIYEFINYKYSGRKDSSYERGIKQIDAVVATLGVATAIKGSEMIDFHEVIETNHRGYLFNVDLE